VRTTRCCNNLHQVTLNILLINQPVLFSNINLYNELNNNWCFQWFYTRGFVDISGIVEYHR